MVDLGSIPGTLVMRWEYILDATPMHAHNYAFSHTLIHNYGQCNNLLNLHYIKWKIEDRIFFVVTYVQQVTIRRNAQ